MSTMELKSSLLKEVAAIINDEELATEVLNAIRALRRKSRIERRGRETEPPCCHTKENIKERVANALMRYKQGEYASQGEMLERTKRWE